MATFRFISLDLGTEGNVVAILDAADDVAASEAFAESDADCTSYRVEELVRGRWGEPLAAFACRMGHPAYA